MIKQTTLILSLLALAACQSVQNSNSSYFSGSWECINIPESFDQNYASKLTTTFNFSDTHFESVSEIESGFINEPSSSTHIAVKDSGIWSLSSNNEITFMSDGAQPAKSLATTESSQFMAEILTDMTAGVYREINNTYVQRADIINDNQFSFTDVTEYPKELAEAFGDINNTSDCKRL